MHISSLEEYGVRCALQLARQYQMGPSSASKIAQLEGISVEYVSKIMHLFRKAQLISSLRGTQGGFTLLSPPDQIHLKQIFDALAGKRNSGDFCSHFAGHQETCVHFQHCAVKPVWQILSNYFDGVLSQISLHDLIHAEKTGHQHLHQLIQQTAQASPSVPRVGAENQGALV